MVWLDGCGLKRNMIGKLIRKTFRQRIWDGSLQMGKQLKDACVLCNCSSNDDQQRKSLTIKQMEWSVWGRVNLFSWPSLPLLYRFMKKVTMIGGMEKSLRLIWLWLLLNAKFVISSDQQWTPSMTLFLGMISLVARWLPWTTSFVEMAILWPHWNRYLFVLCICSSYT